MSKKAERDIDSVKVAMRTPTGKEPVDVYRVVSTLHEAGYRGFLNIEYEEEDDPMSGVPRVVEQLRRWLEIL